MDHRFEEGTMKQEHKIIAAVAVLLVLGIGVYVSRGQSEKEEQEHTVTAAKDLPAIKLSDADAEKLTKIVIDNADKGAVTLVKKGDKWEVDKPVKAAADDQAVKSLIDNAKKLELQALIAETADVHEKYDLNEEKAVHAQLFKGDSKVLDIYFGKGGSRGQMARLADSDAVYAAKGYSQYTWAREPSNWRDKKVLKFEDKNAIQIEIENEHGKYSFTRTDDKLAKAEGEDEEGADKKAPEDKGAASSWAGSFYARSDGGKLGAAAKKIEDFDPKKVDQLLVAFKNLNATNFAEEGADTGVDDPIANEGGILRVKLKDDAGDYEVRVGNKQEGSNRYLVKEGDPTVYVITSYAADWVTAKPEKFAVDKKAEGEHGEDLEDLGDMPLPPMMKEGRPAPKIEDKGAPKPKAPAPPAPKTTPKAPPGDKKGG
jgi:hypothetical protein